MLEIIIHSAVLLFTFYLLAIVCDYFFVPSLENIAKKWRMSSEFAGATLMAVGSSAPELFTSLFAVLNPAVAPSLGAGAIVGSAIFNVLVIIGAAAMVRQATITRQPVMRDLFFYGIAILLLLFVFHDGQIVYREMLVFLGTYILYVRCAKNRRKRFGYKQTEWEEDIEMPGSSGSITNTFVSLLSHFIPQGHGKKYLQAFFWSIVIIGVATHFMVESAVHVATILGIPPAIIGLTILAIGTSVPDLLSSLVVAKKGKGDMAITNAIGSNIFDILFGLSVPYLIYFMINDSISSLQVDATNLQASIVLLFATVVAVGFLLVLRRWKIGRWSGLFLIILYLIYLLYTIIPIL